MRPPQPANHDEEAIVRYQALMIRRIDPRHVDAVAEIFAEHDRTDLPGRIGVRQRTLFHLRGLYAHLVQSDEDFLSRLYAARDDPLLRDIDERLRRYLTPYEPSLPSMADSQATAFYDWRC
jgi:cyclase